MKQIFNKILRVPKESMRLEVFELLFTPDELRQLQKRFEIIKSLLKGDETQRALAARLDLSIAKITRGSHALKRASPELKAYLGDIFHE